MTAESRETPQSFYIAILLYESSSDVPNYPPLYEECFLLLKATSQEEAEQKAQHYGNHPTSYLNEFGETITWKLKHVVDVNAVLDDSFNDHTELYARHFHNYEAYSTFEPVLSGEEL